MIQYVCNIPNDRYTQRSLITSTHDTKNISIWVQQVKILNNLFSRNII